MRVKRTNGLTTKQEGAILALLDEPTVARAAEKVGVTDRSLYRWLEEPAFSAAYRRARREAFKHATSLCQKYLPHAVQALVQIMADKAASDSARVSAATAVMKFSRESLELDDLAERIVKLEQSQQHPPDPGPFGQAA